MNNKLTIITRTSNRPKAFKRCLESIKNSYAFFDIESYILFDDVNTNYIKDLPQGSTIEYVRPTAIEDTINDRGKVCRPAPYNLYLNYALENIDSGYVMFLDDDDYIASPYALTCLEDWINKPRRLVLFNGHFKPNKNLPTEKAINLLKQGENAPIGSIGGRCFAFDIRLVKENGIYWDGYKCGDNRFVNALAKVAHKVEYETNTVTTTKAGAGHGEKKDS